MKQQRTNKPQLVWDSNDCYVSVQSVSLMFSPSVYGPFVPAAVAEEQDTFLLMGEQRQIVEPKQPAWALANRLDSQPTLPPGSVIRKGVQPLRLVAIIHDVAQSPTWHTEWVEQALRAVFAVVDELSLPSLKLPLLASACHNFDEASFMRTLLRVIMQREAEQALKIWIPCREGRACIPLADTARQLIAELKLD